MCGPRRSGRSCGHCRRSARPLEGLVGQREFCRCGRDSPLRCLGAAALMEGGGEHVTGEQLRAQELVRVNQLRLRGRASPSLGLRGGRRPDAVIRRLGATSAQGHRRRGLKQLLRVDQLIATRAAGGRLCGSRSRASIGLRRALACRPCRPRRFQRLFNRQIGQGLKHRAGRSFHRFEPRNLSRAESGIRPLTG